MRFKILKKKVDFLRENGFGYFPKREVFYSRDSRTIATFEFVRDKPMAAARRLIGKNPMDEVRLYSNEKLPDGVKHLIAKEIGGI